MCQFFNHFSVSLHHFVLAKLATSSIRVDLITVVRIYGNFNNNLGMNS